MVHVSGERNDPTGVQLKGSLFSMLESVLTTAMAWFGSLAAGEVMLSPTVGTADF